MQIHTVFHEMPIAETHLKTFILSAMSGQPDLRAFAAGNEMWEKRCLNILQSFGEFTSLSAEQQSRVWRGVLYPSLALMAAKMDDMDNLYHQLTFNSPSVDFDCIVKNLEVRKRLEALPPYSLFDKNSMGGMVPSNIAFRLEIAVKEVIPYFRQKTLFYLCVLTEIIRPTYDLDGTRFGRLSVALDCVLAKLMSTRGCRELSSLEEARVKFRNLSATFDEWRRAVEEQMGMVRV